MHLSEEQLQFLARFSKSPDGRALVLMLQAKLGAVEAKLRTSTGEEVYRTQGRALVLDELIADIEGAQQKLNRAASTRTSVYRADAS